MLLKEDHGAELNHQLRSILRKDQAVIMQHICNGICKRIKIIALFLKIIYRKTNFRPTTFKKYKLKIITLFMKQILKMMILIYIQMILIIHKYKIHYNK